MASKSVEQLNGQTKISSYERIGYKRYLLELMTSKFALILSDGAKYAFATTKPWRAEPC
jgi:hypothetical protein